MLDLGIMFQVVATAALFLCGSYVTYRQRTKHIKKMHPATLDFKEETAL